MAHRTVKCCKQASGFGHPDPRLLGSFAADEQSKTLHLCYECGNQGHYRSDCPELKNGNQDGGAGNT
ncbi:reverse transcriptase domain-containing protein [Tanacetum coccineum]